MTEFALFFWQNKEDKETDALLSIIQNGFGAEAQRAIEKLTERAQVSLDPDDLNAVGLAFHKSGMNDRATEVFEMLVQQEPTVDIYRMNLAAAYSQTGQVELCRVQLRHLAEHGSTERFREIGREQLRGYEAFLGLTEEDQKLAELQIKSLRRAIQSPKRKVEDFLRLAKLFLRRGHLESQEKWLPEATTVLEKGGEAFPKDPQILEHLVAVYLRSDPNKRLDKTLAELEKLAPDSSVLELLASQDEEGAQAFLENNYRRAGTLMAQVFESRDPSIRDAALRDLGKIVAMYPQNSGYRLQYAFALMAAGKYELSLETAKKLAVEPDDSHSFHFNLGQIFWGSGDPVQGRDHLNLALHYASDEQERQDTRDRIADLERQKK